MTCTCGKPYIIKSGDTLSIIAERELGDGSRWKEITKPNCTPFSDSEARGLQPLYKTWTTLPSRPTKCL